MTEQESLGVGRLYNFQVMVIRYRARVAMYAGFTHEQSPKFEFSMSQADPAGDPAESRLCGWPS